MSEDPTDTVPQRPKTMYIPVIEEDDNGDDVIEVAAFPSERQAKLVLRALRDNGWPARRLGINYVRYYRNVEEWEAAEGSEWGA